MTVIITGLTNPHFWNLTFGKANLTVAYYHSGLATLALATYSFPVTMTPDVVKPITAYSESPFIGTSTYLELSFATATT